jgi:hypothetical protein
MWCSSTTITCSSSDTRAIVTRSGSSVARSNGRSTASATVVSLYSTSSTTGSALATIRW